MWATLALTIVDSDCSGLIPPCWQELHYLFAGVALGFLVAFPVYEALRRYWGGESIV